MPSGKTFQSPPGSGSNDGASPLAYEQGWQGYINLTSAQKLWFASQPQFLNFFIKQRRWLAETAPGGAVSVTVNPVGGTGPVSIPVMADDRSKTLLIGMRQAIDDSLITQVPFSDAAGNSWTLTAADAKAVHAAVMTYIQQLFAVQQTLLAGIGTTTTNPAQVESAIAAVAPNSASAKTPQTFT